MANIRYYRLSDGKWINKYKTTFIIMNEKGQPIQWKFTKTEKFDEVSDMFSQLSERFQQQKQKLSGIYTDTCCKWAGKFEDVFPGVPIKLDIFHAIQCFTSSISKKKKYYSKLARDYSLVFQDPVDLGTKRMKDTPAKEVILKTWKNLNGNGKMLNTKKDKCFKQSCFERNKKYKNSHSKRVPVRDSTGMRDQ